MTRELAVRWPFTLVADARHRGIGWAVINAPVVSPSRLEQFAELRREGFRFVGMASDGVFPQLDAPDPLDYAAICEAWLHCFREPDRYLPAGVPRAPISNSDFTDSRRLAAEVGDVDDAGPDLVYVGASEPWKQEAKNWPFARTHIPRICDALGLRALIVGVPADDVAKSRAISCVPALPWRELLRAIASAKVLFVPNTLDASPRVLTEALALDVPVVVNRNILGGWKYINAFTGTFFDSDDDVLEAVRACLDGTKKPRRWFDANFGPYHSGRRLLDVLRALDPSIEETSHLVISERVDVPTR
jgi:glycosyltransferase involved in cell wall biosynthesis